MNLKRLLVAGALVGGGGMILTIVPILAVVVLLGGFGSALGGFFGFLTGGGPPPSQPPIATPLTHPFEWIPLINQTTGIPNTLVLAAMAAGSGGNVLGNTYFCSNGHTASSRCSTVYHPGAPGQPVGRAGTIAPAVHTLGIGNGLLNIENGPIPPPQAIQAGAADLARALAQNHYLPQAIAAFHREYQAPPGYVGSGQYASAVQADLAQYAVPQMGAWSLGTWTNGTWQDPNNQPAWVFVAAAAPMGAPWSFVLGPPICVIPGRGLPEKCQPDLLKGRDMVPPVAVTATLANGTTVSLTASGGPNGTVPVWPGGLVYGAKIPFQQGVTLTAYWPGTTASLSFPSVWSSSGSNGGPSGPVGTLSAAGVWQQWKTLILQASAATGVPAVWIAAEIAHESGGSATAGSPAGAYGLMQLEPATGAAYGCTNRGNPTCNVMAGSRYLAALYRQFRSWRGASAGYYGGGGTEAHLLNAAGLPPPQQWSTAQGALQVVPFPQAGNTLTLAAYANAIWSTAQQLSTQFHLPPP